MTIAKPAPAPFDPLAWRRRLAVAAAAILLVAAAPGDDPQSAPPTQPPPAPPPAQSVGEAPVETVDEPAVEVVTARVVSRSASSLYRTASPGHADVVEIRPFLRHAGRASWSLQGDWIAFDRADSGGRRQVHLIRPDGTGERCLTCDTFSLRGLSMLDPVWHPSGNWLLIRAQNLPPRLLPSPALLATPLGGVHSELWAVAVDGRDAWQLTREREHGGAVGTAVFSHEGGHLAWSSRVATLGGPVGEWVLRVGEADWRRGVARLHDVRTIELRPRGLHMVSAFTPDDRGLLVTSDRGEATEREVAVVTLGDGSSRPLGSAGDAAERLAVTVPRGDALVWVSDRGLEPARQLPYRGDLWLRSWDGDQPGAPPLREERLTFFNDPSAGSGLAHPADPATPAATEALVDDIAWSPQGDRLLLHVVTSDGTGEVEESLWLVILTAGYHR